MDTFSSCWLAGQGSASLLTDSANLEDKENNLLLHFPHRLPREEPAPCLPGGRELTFLSILIACCSFPRLFSNLIRNFSFYFPFPFHHSLSNYSFSISLTYLIFVPLPPVATGIIVCVVVSCYIYISGLVVCCDVISGFLPKNYPPGIGPLREG